MVFQEINGLSEAIVASGGRGAANGFGASEDSGNTTPSSSRFGLRFPGINASFLTRTRSATIGMLQQTRSTASQRL